jgi:hypothetical protein
VDFKLQIIGLENHYLADDHDNGLLGFIPRDTTMVHVRSTSMALVAQIRRIPTPLAITIGVLVGLFIANMLPGNVSRIS